MLNLLQFNLSVCYFVICHEVYDYFDTFFVECFVVDFIFWIWTNTNACLLNFVESEFRWNEITIDFVGDAIYDPHFIGIEASKSRSRLSFITFIWLNLNLPNLFHFILNLLLLLLLVISLIYQIVLVCELNGLLVFYQLVFDVV